MQFDEDGNLIIPQYGLPAKITRKKLRSFSSHQILTKNNLKYEILTKFEKKVIQQLKDERTRLEGFKSLNFEKYL